MCTRPFAVRGTPLDIEQVVGAMRVLCLAHQMMRKGKTGSIVTLLCDSGERYLDTYYNPQWVESTIGSLSEANLHLYQLLNID